MRQAGAMSFIPPTDTTGGKERDVAGVKYLLTASGNQAVIVSKWLLEYC